MGKRALFTEFLGALRTSGVEIVSLIQVARNCLTHPTTIPVCQLNLAPFDGRSGLLAVQGPRL
jgi:hypothetical protein